MAKKPNGNETIYRHPDTNAVLTDRTAIVNAMRKGAAETAEALGKSLAQMSDAKVWELVSAIPGNGPDVDDMRLDALVNYDPQIEEIDTEETPKTQGGRPRVTVQERIASYQGAAEFFAIGKRLDEKTTGHFNVLADAKETYDGSTMTLVDDFYRQFCERDAHGNITKNQIVTWPVPGTGTDKNPAKGNNPPDRYERTNPVTGAKITGSVYTDMFEGSAPGQRWLAINDVLSGIKSDSGITQAEKDVLNDNIRDADIRKLLPLIFDHNDADAIDRVRKWNNGRKTSILTKIRFAVRVIQQKDAIENLKNIHVLFVANGDMLLASKIKQPIKLASAGAGGLLIGPDPCSIATFLRYDVFKAKAMAAVARREVVIADLVATARKQPKPKASKIDYPQIADMKQFVVAADRFYSFLKSTSITSLMDACNSDTDGDALVLAFGRIGDKIDAIRERTNVRFDKLVAAESNKREAAAS